MKIFEKEATQMLWNSDGHLTYQNVSAAACNSIPSCLGEFTALPAPQKLSLGRVCGANEGCESAADEWAAGWFAWQKWHPTGRWSPLNRPAASAGRDRSINSASSHALCNFNSLYICSRANERFLSLLRLLFGHFIFCGFSFCLVNLRNLPPVESEDMYFPPLQ